MPSRRQVAAGRATWTTALAALVALAGVSSAQATFSGRNGRVAVSWYFGNCALQIATIRPDGERFRRLTSCRSGAEDPEWSPDGRRMLYSRDGGVRVMAADGSRQRFVLPPAPPIDGFRVLRAEPSFAPDAKRFAYTRGLQRGAEIWTARLDGSRDRRLRAGSAPRWSPDGRRIALSHGHDIVVADAHTGRRIRRIHMPGQSLDWSPDGRRLLFIANGPTFSPELYVVRADSGPVKRITTTRADEADAVWSPDGRSIAVVRAQDCGDSSRVYSIWTMSRRATHGKRIYSDGCRDTEELGGPPLVSWQPLPAR